MKTFGSPFSIILAISVFAKRQFNACATKPACPQAKNKAKYSIEFCERIDTLSPFSKPSDKRPFAIFFTKSSSSLNVILL